MNENRTRIEKLIGRIDEDYYVCDDFFNHSADFYGVTGTILRPVSADERDDRTNPYNSDTQDRFFELWQDAVQADTTRQGFEEWLKEVLSVEGDDIVFDFSGSDYWDLIRAAEPELTEDVYPVFECIGGGRCFGPDMKFDKVYDPELWARIQKLEANMTVKSEISEALERARNKIKKIQEAWAPEHYVRDFDLIDRTILAVRNELDKIKNHTCWEGR